MWLGASLNPLFTPPRLRRQGKAAMPHHSTASMRQPSNRVSRSLDRAYDNYRNYRKEVRYGSSNSYL